MANSNHVKKDKSKKKVVKRVNVSGSKIEPKIPEKERRIPSNGQILHTPNKSFAFSVYGIEPDLLTTDVIKGLQTDFTKGSKGSGKPDFLIEKTVILTNSHPFAVYVKSELS